MFASIKEALTKKETNANFQDFLKLEVGKQYIVRLLPNVADPLKTVFHYYQHIWDSVQTGRKINVLCPYTYGERCPIDEYRASVYRKFGETSDQVKDIQPLKRTEHWLYNVYVVSDPTNAENEGKVKILRAGKQLNKIIDAAINGDDAEEFGEKVFDLSENGCNLKIKVEKNEGGFPTYVSSRFSSPSKLDIQDDNIDAIYESVKALDAMWEHKSYEQVQTMLNEHFLGKSSTPIEEASTESTPETTTEPETDATSLTDATEGSNAEQDDRMKKLLDELNEA